MPDYQPVPDTKYHKGDTVKVLNAIQYDNGEPFSTYYDEYSVLSASGRRVVIGIDGVITAAIDEDNISLVRCIYDNDNDINTDTVSRGDGKKVRVLDNIDYDGNRFGVYYDEYDVIEEDGDRIVIGIGTTITAAVNIANLEFVGGSGSDDTPIARVPFISQSRRIRDYQDLSETIENQTLPSRLRTPIFTLQEEQVYLQPGQ